MKVGDLIIYTDEVNDRLGENGIVIATDPIWDGNQIEAALVEVYWDTGEFEKVFTDELRVINI